MEQTMDRALVLSALNMVLLGRKPGREPVRQRRLPEAADVSRDRVQHEPL